MKTVQFILFNLFLVISFAPLSWAEWECPNKIDPNRVVVFVDTNFAFKEIEKAREATCKRGEQFIVATHLSQEDYLNSLKKETLYKKIDQAYLDYATCTENNTHENCFKKLDRAQSLEIELSKIEENIASAGEVTVDSLQKIFSNLAKNNKSITSLIFSGHDGGDEVSGDAGKILLAEATDALKKSYKDHPELLIQLQSVYAWGCYTGTPLEIKLWKNRLPSLRFIVGFGDTSPSKDRLAGYQLMYNLLVNENDILSLDTSSQIQTALNHVQYLNHTLSAVYAKSCRGVQYYRQNINHGLSDDKTYLKIKTEFKTFETALDCDDVELVETLEKGFSDIRKYFNGTVEIPENTATGLLRQKYSLIRNFSHCGQVQDYFLNADQIGLLNFYRGVVNNFYSTFKNEILSASQEYERYIEKHKESKQFSDEVIKEFPYSFPTKQENLVNQWNNRERLKKDIHSLETAIQKIQKITNSEPTHLIRLNKLINSYLYELDTRCMNFLEWHEYTTEKTATPQC